MPDLIAYIPVLNQRHLDWFRKYPDSTLYLIPDNMAAELVPRLARNMAAVPTEVQQSSIESLPYPWNALSQVEVFGPGRTGPWIHGGTREILRVSEFVLPDEDVSHAVAEKYFKGSFAIARFEMIWARWDMSAVKRQSPVMADVEVTSSRTDQLRMCAARRIGSKSPDWWRQVGALISRGDELLGCACNEHHPDEYTTYVFGDPRLNVDAGQVGKYSSFHSEKATICRCAARGIPTKGASIYITVFPCEDCARAIKEAEIAEVFFEEGYSALDAQEVLHGAGIRMIQVIKDPEPA